MPQHTRSHSPYTSNQSSAHRTRTAAGIVASAAAAHTHKFGSCVPWHVEPCAQRPPQHAATIAATAHPDITSILYVRKLVPILDAAKMVTHTRTTCAPFSGSTCARGAHAITCVRHTYTEQLPNVAAGTMPGFSLHLSSAPLGKVMLLIAHTIAQVQRHTRRTTTSQRGEDHHAITVPMDK